MKTTERIKKVNATNYNRIFRRMKRCGKERFQYFYLINDLAYCTDGFRAVRCCPNTIDNSLVRDCFDDDIPQIFYTLDDMMKTDGRQEFVIEVAEFRTFVKEEKSKGMPVDSTIIKIKTDGGTVYLNIRYLLDAVTMVREDTARLYFNNDNLLSPVVIKVGQGQYNEVTTLLMPCRPSKDSFADDRKINLTDYNFIYSV